MSLSTPPAAGQQLLGSRFAALVHEARVAEVRMSGDQALATSSTALQNVTTLVLPAPVHSVWDGYLFIGFSVNVGATEDIKVGFVFPSLAEFDFGTAGPATTVGAGGTGDGEWTFSPLATSGTTTTAMGTNTTPTSGLIPFRLTVRSVSGTLQVQAAQNTSGLNTVTVRQGSKLYMERVA